MLANWADFYEFPVGHYADRIRHYLYCDDLGTISRPCTGKMASGSTYVSFRLQKTRERMSDLVAVDSAKLSL